ncbi:MAG: DUF4340 domain-containing protein [Ignavibacteriae bacterium]|nr:DUF4340 domain-containing protein [Ignavibacteriota bacterium]
MKRSSYFLLFLVVIVLVVAYFYIKPKESQESTYEKPDITLTFDIGKITKIEIDKNKQYIRFEKIKDRWKIIDPINTYADDEAIYGLLEGFAKFSLLGLISSNPQKQAMYEVDDKGTSVTVTTDGNQQTTLIVGKLGQTSGQAYVRPASSGSVYLAKGLVPSLVGKSLSDWRQKTVVRVEPRMMKMLTVLAGGERAVFKRDDKKWTSGGATVPAKRMKPAVQQLSYLRAEGFIDTVVFLSGSPALHVELMTDELMRLDFYNHPKFKNQYLLKSSTDQKLYVVNKSSVKDISALVGGMAEQPEETYAAEPDVPTTGGGGEVDDSYKPTGVEANADISPEARKVLQSILQQSRGTALSSQEGLPAATGIEDSGELTVYTCKSGDNIASVSRKHNVTEEQLMKWNILKPGDVLKPGMELYVYLNR